MAKKLTKAQIAKNPTKAINSGQMKMRKQEVPFGSSIKAAAKVISKVAGSRAAKDAKIIASSPHLKQTPNMTIKQAKRMKQGTKSLAKTTNRIAKQSSKKGSYGRTTVGESNAFKIKMGLDKPFPGVEVKAMPALSTPSLGGLKKGPSNMTLNQLDKLSAIENSEKAKAYAAAYRQAKRETKGMKKAMESKKVRTTKRVVKGTAVAGTAGGAYAASKKKKAK
jgi:hypothetical protein